MRWLFGLDDLDVFNILYVLDDLDVLCLLLVEFLNLPHCLLVNLSKGPLSNQVWAIIEGVPHFTWRVHILHLFSLREGSATFMGAVNLTT